MPVAENRKLRLGEVGASQRALMTSSLTHHGLPRVPDLALGSRRVGIQPCTSGSKAHVFLPSVNSLPLLWTKPPPI